MAVPYEKAVAEDLNLGTDTVSVTMPNGGSATGNKINLSTLSNGLRAQATYDPGSLADGAGETTTVTVTGAALGDFAMASFSNNLQGIILFAWVSAANTVSVRFQNETGGTVDLASGTLKVMAFAAPSFA